MGSGEKNHQFLVSYGFFMITRGWDSFPAPFYEKSRPHKLIESLIS